MKLLVPFLLRDWRIERTYRFAMALQLGEVVAAVAGYYFLSQFVDGRLDEPVGPYAGGYFAFVLVGLTLHAFLATGLESISRRVREAQLAGNLEALLTTPFPAGEVALCTMAYPLLATAATSTAWFALGAGLFGLSLPPANWAGAAAVLALSTFAFAGLGIFSASFVLVFQRGSPVPPVVEALSFLLAGVLYPVDVLPGWLRVASTLFPLTHSIRGTRDAVLGGAGWSALVPSLLPLALFAAFLFPLGLASFALATRYGRRSGTLGHS